MPVYKDEERKTWYASFYYTAWNGERKLKKKRGFKTQREAKEYEREFSVKSQENPEMTFKSLVDLYFIDIQNRVRETTTDTKRNMFDTHITPVLGDMKICDITPATVRHWQNEMLKKRQGNGKPYSQTYLRSVNSQLSAILNYAVKFHQLKYNPCSRVDPIGKKKSKEMDFWTLDEFNRAISYEKAPAFHLCFMLLFWGGFRIGEVLALTPADIIEDSKSVMIQKTHHRKDGKDSSGPTKSDNSERIVELPDFVFDELADYSSRLYGIQPEDRILYFQRNTVNNELNTLAEKSGVKRIRVHDLRHSHVSLLIELGFQVHAIAKRIGDTPETVNRTYAHLYPHVGQTIAEALTAAQNGMSGQNEKKQPI